MGVYVVVGGITIGSIINVVGGVLLGLGLINTGIKVYDYYSANSYVEKWDIATDIVVDIFKIVLPAGIGKSFGKKAQTVTEWYINKEDVKKFFKDEGEK